MIRNLDRSVVARATAVAALFLAAACDTPVAPARNTSTTRSPEILGMTAQAPIAGPLSATVPLPIPAEARSGTPRMLRVPASGPRLSTGTATAAPTVTILWHDLVEGWGSLWVTQGARFDGTYGALPKTPTAWRMAAYGDLTGDAVPDVVWQNAQTGERSVWFMTPTQWALQSVALPTVAPEWSIAGTGDFDRDGHTDLVWQNTRTGGRSIWFMNGARFEGRVALLPLVPVEWRIAAVGDFNGDGRPDLVWQHASGYVSIWLMDGASWNGAYAALPTVPTQWRIAAAADFDGDAKLDLLWQNAATGERVVWFMNGASWNGANALLGMVPTSWNIVGAATAPSLGAPTTDAVAPTVSVTGVANGGAYPSGPTVTLGATDDVALETVPMLVTVRRIVGGVSTCATSLQVVGGVVSGFDTTPTSAPCPMLQVTSLATSLFAQAGSYTLVAAAIDRAGNVSAPVTVSFVVGAP